MYICNKERKQRRGKGADPPAAIEDAARRRFCCRRRRSTSNSSEIERIAAVESVIVVEASLTVTDEAK
ncbi:hypothetical protein M5689_018945 [Euphorbia peplus]|nr:hypothetical protein M5689_018945 [Euphorbia peplus]